ncbi:MAG TPA: serine hydrolase domain-containing protein [Acidimicrobiia bacterium]|jgi:D-alanyl-D-alanine carboxypeptidase
MGRRVVVAFVVALALMVVPVGTAAADGHGRHHGGPRPFPPQLAAKLQGAIQLAQQGYDAPGIAVAVHQPGVGDLTVTAGHADIASNTPVTPATHFRIGSVTKTFTATVILQLVQEHRLSLSKDIDQWFPQLPYAEQITIRDLLDMHSGIFDEGGGTSSLTTAANANPTASWTIDQIVAFAIEDGSKPPGTPGYSDTNYAMLAAIAAAVTHTPYPKLLERTILHPLHLDHTSFPTTSMTMPSPAATPYVVGLPNGNPANPIVVVAKTLNPSVLGGAGAMISTLPDIERWSRAFGSGELLSPTMRRVRLQLQSLPGVGPFVGLPGFTNGTQYPATYGLGIAEVDNFVGHNGIFGGFTSESWYDPATGASIAILLNSQIFETNAKGTTIIGYLGVPDALFTSLAQILQRQT